jgi:hypothetical protein
VGIVDSPDKPVNARKHTYESNLARRIKLKLDSDGQVEPVPRVAISFPARPKIWGCARTQTLTD